MTNSLGGTSTYEYDALGRLLKQHNVDDTILSLDYDDANNIVTLTNEEAEKQRKLYDGLGRDWKTQVYVNGVWEDTSENHYDIYGNVDWIKDALGNKTQYEYDLNGRLVKTIYADKTYSTITYDDVKKSVTKINEENDKSISFLRFTWT